MSEQQAAKRIQVGDTVAAQTVTYLIVGVVQEKTVHDLLLWPCAIVYDTGDFGQFASQGTVSVAEPMAQPAEVNRAALTFVTRWPFPVPSQPVPGDREDQG